MVTKIRTVVEEMRDCYRQITKVDHDTSLTTIQKRQYADSIRKSFESKGVVYGIHIDTDNFSTDNSNLNIIFPYYINDVGTIADVSTKGKYPIRISIENNISILFEPRNLKKMDSWKVYELNNSEFIHLKKGDNYQINGRIESCQFYFKSKPEGNFVFYIQGEHPKKDNCFIATAAFGDINNLQVLKFRTFRDNKLMPLILGRCFVKFYYFVSPPIAFIIR